ncbi:hypothetical protein GQ42DRAFT_156589 [Ramicandelaber brevisporus]|nr:hypothetical protein GQ42DRAFT_156589 [Ramicandelaber brevisporus]
MATATTTKTAVETKTSTATATVIHVTTATVTHSAAKANLEGDSPASASSAQPSASTAAASSSPMPPMCAFVKERQDIRSLSRDDIDRLIRAIDTLRNVPSTDVPGLSRWETLIYWHALAQQQVRVDARFFPFYRAFVARFEDELRMVDSNIKSVPFWDLGADALAPEQGVLWKITASPAPDTAAGPPTVSAGVPPTTGQQQQPTNSVTVVVTTMTVTSTATFTTTTTATSTATATAVSQLTETSVTTQTSTETSILTISATPEPTPVPMPETITSTAIETVTATATATATETNLATITTTAVNTAQATATATAMMTTTMTVLDDDWRTQSRTVAQITFGTQSSSPVSDGLNATPAATPQLPHPSTSAALSTPANNVVTAHPIPKTSRRSASNLNADQPSTSAAAATQSQQSLSWVSTKMDQLPGHMSRPHTRDIFRPHTILPGDRLFKRQAPTQPNSGPGAGPGAGSGIGIAGGSGECLRDGPFAAWTFHVTPGGDSSCISRTFDSAAASETGWISNDSSSSAGQAASAPNDASSPPGGSATNNSGSSSNSTVSRLQQQLRRWQSSDILNATVHNTPLYRDFRHQIELGIHANVHNFIGGTMLQAWSPADSLVFLAVHSYIDKLWNDWQQVHETGSGSVKGSRYEGSLDEALPIANVPIRELMDVDKLCYRYVEHTGSAAVFTQDDPMWQQQQQQQSPADNERADPALPENGPVNKSGIVIGRISSKGSSSHRSVDNVLVVGDVGSNATSSAAMTQHRAFPEVGSAWNRLFSRISQNDIDRTRLYMDTISRRVSSRLTSVVTQQQQQQQQQQRQRLQDSREALSAATAATVMVNEMARNPFPPAVISQAKGLASAAASANPSTSVIPEDVDQALWELTLKIRDTRDTFLLPQSTQPQQQSAAASTAASTTASAASAIDSSKGASIHVEAQFTGRTGPRALYPNIVEQGHDTIGALAATVAYMRDAYNRGFSGVVLSIDFEPPLQALSL